MKFDQIISSIYDSLSNDANRQSLELIKRHGIRVENFFLVKIIDTLENLKKLNSIKNFSVQLHVTDDETRKHIDLMLIDNNSIRFHIELKHFSISKNRNLLFYTNERKEGKKVGIIKDVEKLDKIRRAGMYPDMKNLVCIGLITPTPTKKDFTEMTSRIREFKSLNNWTINFPILYEKQNKDLGLFYLSRSFN